MYEEGSWQSHERRKEDEKRTSQGASKIPPAVRIVALLYTLVFCWTNYGSTSIIHFVYIIIAFEQVVDRGTWKVLSRHDLSMYE